MPSSPLRPDSRSPREGASSVTSTAGTISPRTSSSSASSRTGEGRAGRRGARSPGRRAVHTAPPSWPAGWRTRPGTRRRRPRSWPSWRPRGSRGRGQRGSMTVTSDGAAGHRESSSAALPRSAPRTSSPARVGSRVFSEAAEAPSGRPGPRAPAAAGLVPSPLSGAEGVGQRAGGVSTAHRWLRGHHLSAGRRGFHPAGPPLLSRPLQGSCVLRTPLPAHPGRQEPREQTGGAPSCCP